MQTFIPLTYSNINELYLKQNGLIKLITEINLIGYGSYEKALPHILECIKKLNQLICCGRCSGKTTFLLKYYEKILKREV